MYNKKVQKLIQTLNMETKFVFAHSATRVGSEIKVRPPQLNIALLKRKSSLKKK